MRETNYQHYTMGNNKGCKFPLLFGLGCDSRDSDDPSRAPGLPLHLGNPSIVEKDARYRGPRIVWAAGIRWAFSPMVDIAETALGRIVEGAAEDSYSGQR